MAALRRAPGLKGLCIGLALLGWQPAPLRAQDSERARLAAERLSLTDGYAAQEQACREQFVVTACVDDVRQRRRLALQPLRARELSLDEDERARKALDRLTARAARTGASAAPASAASAGLVGPSLPTASAPLRAPQPGTPGRDRSTAATNPSAEARALQAAERARAAARRAETLDALQAEVARKSAERAANARRSAPLPPPAAPSPVASASASRR
jgi:hypothetical protein